MTAAPMDIVPDLHLHSAFLAFSHSHKRQVTSLQSANLLIMNSYTHIHTLMEQPSFGDQTTHPQISRWPSLPPELQLPVERTFWFLQASVIITILLKLALLPNYMMINIDINNCRFVSVAVEQSGENWELQRPPIIAALSSSCTEDGKQSELWTLLSKLLIKTEAGCSEGDWLYKMFPKTSVLSWTQLCWRNKGISQLEFSFTFFLVAAHCSGKSKKKAP